MGADMFLADAHRIIVTGPTRLRGGRVLDSRDLRSGMSLIAAGLAAEGQTRVLPLETVERGELPLLRGQKPTLHQLLVREMILQLKKGKLDVAYIKSGWGRTWSNVGTSQDDSGSGRSLIAPAFARR